MSVARLLIPVYIQHSALYTIWIFLWMDGSAADSAMSCKQFSNPDMETTVFKDDGCFLLSREERTWEESKSFCNGLGDGWSLVVIEDVETQKLVDNVTRTAGVSTGSWIGLRRQNGYYTWESGNKLGFPDFFKELADGEVQSTGDCVTTSPPDDTPSYGIWSYMDCTARLYSICHSVLTPGSPLPPRKTATSRRTTSSTLNATSAKPQMTVKYGATQSTATSTQSTTASTQSTATTTQSTATTTQSTTTTMQSTATSTQSTAATTQSTTTTTQSTAASTQSTAATTQSTTTTMQSTATSTQSTAATTQSTAATTKPTATTTQSTEATTTTTSSTTVLIAVSSTAASVAAVFLVGGLIALCRRNKQKRLRVTMAADDTESGTVADVRTKPEVEYAVVTKIQTKQPSQVHACNTESGYHYASVDDGARPMKQGVNDQTYDTATITEKKQPITFDNTYARAMFSQSAEDTDDVYDHTRVTGKASQEVDASHYDHAFVK